MRLSRRPTQVQLIASAVVEPDPSHGGLYMLDGLPEREARFYAQEANVISMTGKSAVLLEELHDRFCFVGGSMDEYAAYYARVDVQSLWSWKRAGEVKCFGGFATVPKKSAGQQRKLLMQVPFNY